MKKLTELTEWKALSRHFKKMSALHLTDFFAKDNDRFSRFAIEAGGIMLDFSRNHVSDKTMALLAALARARNLENKINDLFCGHPVNRSENRPALHSALRDPSLEAIFVNRQNIKPMLRTARQQQCVFVDQVHRASWLGTTGKPIRHILNIGIGGSHLGPLMSTQALKEFAVSDLRFHFVSSVDKAHLDDVWSDIDPETTLFIVSSKSFSTTETLSNAQTLASRMKKLFGDNCISKHFVAVTSAKNKALAFGIPESQIFPMWDWVGGRFSIWSAIGLPLMLMIGNKHFTDFLSGAHTMDLHFQQAPFEKNMPVVLALLSIWYTNFFGAHSQAIVPYAYRLRYLVPYLQQAMMESNGKSVDVDGQPLDYATSPIIFGEEGCNGQHTYHQLLHQGSHIVPVDFILVGNTSTSDQEHHQLTLLASGLSQALALMLGKTNDSTESKDMHRHIPGNRPSNTLYLERITPQTLGALIALYEHKIFVKSVIWDINPFDQWGVELGKELLPDILKALKTGNHSAQSQTIKSFIHHMKKSKDSG